MFSMRFLKWDTYYSLWEKKTETTLNVSFFEKIMSRQLFFKSQGTIINLGNKLTVFQMIVCETVVNKIYNF